MTFYFNYKFFSFGQSTFSFSLNFQLKMSFVSFLPLFGDIFFFNYFSLLFWSRFTASHPLVTPYFVNKWVIKIIIGRRYENQLNACNACNEIKIGIEKITGMMSFCCYIVYCFYFNKESAHVNMQVIEAGLMRIIQIRVKRRLVS